MPEFFQIEDDSLQFQHLDRIDTRERFVEQQQLRLNDQRSRDLDPAALAARERVALVVSHGLEAQLLNQLVHTLAALASAHALTLERIAIRFSSTVSLREDRRLLRQIADAEAGALIHRHVGDVSVVPSWPSSNRPESGLIRPHDHINEVVFPAPFGPRRPHHLALLDPQRDVIHHLAAAVRFADFGGLKGMH